MSGGNMSVGVIIPNHNYGIWIGCALHSIFNQTVKPKQIIVIDDGSTDNSLNQISTCCEATWELNAQGTISKFSSRVKDIDILGVSFPKARGPSFARNYAIGLMSKVP